MLINQIFLNFLHFFDLVLVEFGFFDEVFAHREVKWRNVVIVCLALVRNFDGIGLGFHGLVRVVFCLHVFEFGSL